MIDRLRSLVYNILYIGVTAAFSLGLVALLPFSGRVFWRGVSLYFKTLAVVQRIAMNWQVTIEGMEHLPRSGAFLVAAKHQSTFETLKLCEILDRPAIILKKELFSIPVWGWHARKMGMIAIDRSSPKKAIKTLLAGVRRVADDGRPIIIFPQGTRVRPDQGAQDAPYKTGIARAYDHLGVPVVPLALNTGLFWPRGGFWKRSGRIVFRFLPPIPPGLTADELMDRLTTTIEDHSHALVADALSHSSSP